MNCSGVCVCVCVCACARARARACVCWNHGVRNLEVTRLRQLALTVKNKNVRDRYGGVNELKKG
jgi:hypothetical protein